MFAFPGISLHLLYLTWFSFSKAVKKPRKLKRKIAKSVVVGTRYWSAWSLYYKACRLRFCSGVAACFGGALEGRGRLSAPECMRHRHSLHRLSKGLEIWTQYSANDSWKMKFLFYWNFYFFPSYAPFSVFPIAHSAYCKSAPFHHLLMDFQK